MLKFKKIFTILLIYFIIIQSYLVFIKPNTISLDFFYTNIIFWVIYFIISNLFIEYDNLLDFKLHIYENAEKFFEKSLKEVTINNGLIFGGITVLNGIMLLIIKMNFYMIEFIYYSVNLFLIIEIICIYIMAFTLKRKNVLSRVIILIILMIMFNFGNSYLGITPINIFKYILNIGSLYEVAIHYIIWLIGGYLLIEYNCKRIEL